MTRVFDEKFEGTGYEESWTEVVGSGSSIDEDALSSDVSSPTNWGTQCCKIINNGNLTYTYAPSGTEAIKYWRVEFVVTAESLPNAEYVYLLTTYNNSSGTDAFHLVFYQNSSGVFQFVCQSWHDGTGHNYYSFITPALDTKYRFEFKWDTTNNLWAWKIDGVAQPNDQDSSSPVTSEGLLTGTHAVDAGLMVLGTSSTTDGYTCYYDLIAADDADWVGEESSGSITIPLFMSNRLRGMGV